jgi:hypothetical protein
MRDLETGHVRGQQREETGTLAGNVPQIAMSVVNLATSLGNVPTKLEMEGSVNPQVTRPQKTPEPLASIKRGDVLDSNTKKHRRLNHSYVPLTFTDEELRIQTPTRVNDPVMRIKMAGLEYSALLDSGGGLSIIGGKIGERLRALGFKFVPSGKEVTLTQGTVILPFAVTLNFAWMGDQRGTLSTHYPMILSKSY